MFKYLNFHICNTGSLQQEFLGAQQVLSFQAGVCGCSAGDQLSGFCLVCLIIKAVEEFCI